MFRWPRLAAAGLVALTGGVPVSWFSGRPSVRWRRPLVEQGGFLCDRDCVGDELRFRIKEADRGHLVIPDSLASNDNRSNFGARSITDRLDCFATPFERTHVVRPLGPAFATATDAVVTHNKRAPVWIRRRARIPGLSGIGPAWEKVGHEGKELALTFSRPMLEPAPGGGRSRLAASGAWIADYADAMQAALDALGPDPRAADLDLARVERLDTFGALALMRLRADPQTQVTGLREEQRGLIEAVARLPRSVPAERPRSRFADGLEATGRALAGLGTDALDFMAMLGRLCEAFGRALFHPRAFRLRSIVHHLDRVGVQAVPIMAMMTFLVGAIIAQQGFFHFRRFGAEDYVVDLVAVLILREIGVLLVTIMAAGRSGSAYTAEIGSMKMREEIDALSTMGFDTAEFLILPRVIALIIAVPALTFLGSLAALAGGGFVAWAYAGMSPGSYIVRLSEAVSIDSFEVGMIKAPFMALAVGVVAAVEGLRVEGSTDSLGRRTTTSVVKSIFLAIVLDGVFAVFFASIGM